MDAIKDPISFLYTKYGGDVELEGTMIMGVHNKCSFQAKLKVNKKIYIASAPSSLLAKRKAALAALRDIRNDDETKKTRSSVEDPPKDGEISDVGAGAPKVDGNNKSSRIFVKDIVQLLSTIPEEQEISNDEPTFKTNTLQSDLAIEYRPTGSRNGELRNSADVAKISQHFDDELPTTSQNAAKCRSLQKRQTEESTSGPSMKKPKLKFSSKSARNAETETEDKETSGEVIFSLELNNTSLGEESKNQCKPVTILNEDLTVVEINNDVEEGYVRNEETELGNEKQKAAVIIDIDENIANYIAENTSLAEKGCAVIEIEEETVIEDTLIPFIETTSPPSTVIEIDQETGDNKSVEEIINECISQILDDKSNSSEVIEINEETDDIRSDPTPIVENTRSDAEDSAIIEIDQETEDNNPIVTDMIRACPSTSEFIEINDDENSSQVVDAASTVIEIDEEATDDHQHITTPHVNDRPISLEEAIEINQAAGFANSGDIVEIHGNDADDIARSNTASEKVKRSVTIKSGMKSCKITTSTIASSAKKHQVKRLARNPINLHGEISEGTTATTPYSPNMYVPPREQPTAVFKKPIWKPYRMHNNRKTNYKRSHKYHPKNVRAIEPMPPTNDEENAVQRLNQICPGIHYNLEAEVGTPGATFFLMSATLNDQKYFGDGLSKSIASMEAAKKILAALNNIIPQIPCINQEQQPVPSHVVRYKVIPQPQQPRWNVHSNGGGERGVPKLGFNMCTLSLPQHEADIVENLILNRFRQVISDSPQFNDFRVLAGIVMTRRLDFENGQVVAIATGTKCINGGKIDRNGCVLNDSHAEVMARRCLMKYLYTQLKWHSSEEWAGDSIFSRNPSGLQYAFSLKPDVNFHLYISTAPCGDASVFSDRTNSEQYGQLRTKVDGGMYTIAIGNRFLPQSWLGIKHGEPLFIMSCSDKIARWNVLGVQGSLLSTLVEPIYLYSIVLGSLFNTQHLYRAVCGRLEQKLNFLPKPYHLNRPLLGQTSVTRSDDIRGAPSIGINWTFGDSHIERVCLRTGLLINHDISFLTKQVLFSKYIYLLQHLPNIGISPCPTNYAKAKEHARDYEIAKQELFDAFQHAGQGCWVKKPLEQNDFTINI